MFDELTISRLLDRDRFVCVASKFTGHSEEYVDANTSVRKNNITRKVDIIFKAGEFRYIGWVMGDRDYIKIAVVINDDSLVYEAWYDFDTLEYKGGL